MIHIGYSLHYQKIRNVLSFIQLTQVLPHIHILRQVSRDIVSTIRLSGGINKSIPPDGINRYRVSPLKLKLDIKHKMLMLNICSVNV